MPSAAEKLEQLAALRRERQRKEEEERQRELELEGGLYPAPQIPTGFRQNYIWQRAQPNLPFRGQLILVE